MLEVCGMLEWASGCGGSVFLMSKIEDVIMDYKVPEQNSMGLIFN